MVMEAVCGQGDSHERILQTELMTQQPMAAPEAGGGGEEGNQKAHGEQAIQIAF